MSASIVTAASRMRSSSSGDSGRPRRTDVGELPSATTLFPLPGVASRVRPVGMTVRLPTEFSATAGCVDTADRRRVASMGGPAGPTPEVARQAFQEGQMSAPTEQFPRDTGGLPAAAAAELVELSGGQRF